MKKFYSKNLMLSSYWIQNKRCYCKQSDFKTHLGF